MNQQRARKQDAAITAKCCDEPKGQGWQCPKCGNPLDCIAEEAFSELYECAQCGYLKRVKA